MAASRHCYSHIMGEVVYGPSHIKSVLGILKICEIIMSLIAIILVARYGWSNTLIEAFYAGTIIGIIVSLVVLILCLTEAGHSLISILKFQFVVYICLFIYLIVVCAIMLSRRYSNYHQAGAIFGLFSCCLYLVDAGISYRAYDFRF